MTEMRKMYQHQISFKDISDSLNISQQIKIIVYYDSTHCAICQLKQIHNWNKYIECLNALTPNVSVYFIISPSNEQIKNTTLNIQHLKLTPYNIILDSTNTFKKINPVIPLNNSSLHTFLLDKGEFYQFNLSSCIRQQNSLTAQFVSFSLSNLANIFYPPPIFTIINLCLL